MAIIQCKYCGKNVSDKAKSCPLCGGILIEDNSEADQDQSVVPLLCEECNAEIPQGATTCPNCGCPVPEKTIEEAAQKVEVTAVKLQMKKSTKKYVGIAIIAVIVVAIGGIIATNSHKKNLETRYAENMEQASYTMLMGASDAEDAANLINKVWRNAIYEDTDSETDKYTRPNGWWVSDFNDALRNLFADSTFCSQIADIEENQESVAELMKQLKNPPAGYEEAYEALKEYYSAYLELTNMATNPSGSLQSYSSNFNEADSNALNCYNAMRLYIGD